MQEVLWHFSPPHWGQPHGTFSEHWDAGNRQMDHFSKGTQKEREREAGEGGAGEKMGEKEGERESREEGK